MAVEVMSGDGAHPQGWAPQASVKQMADTTCGGWNHLRVRLLACAGWLIYIRLRHKGLPTVGGTVPWAEAPECRGRRQWAEPKHSSFSAPWLWRTCGSWWIVPEPWAKAVLFKLLLSKYFITAAETVTNTYFKGWQDLQLFLINVASMLGESPSKWCEAEERQQSQNQRKEQFVMRTF